MRNDDKGIKAGGSAESEPAGRLPSSLSATMPSTAIDSSERVVKNKPKKNHGEVVNQILGINHAARKAFHMADDRKSN